MRKKTRSKKWSMQKNGSIRKKVDKKKGSMQKKGSIRKGVGTKRGHYKDGVETKMDSIQKKGSMQTSRELPGERKRLFTSPNHTARSCVNFASRRKSRFFVPSLNPPRNPIASRFFASKKIRYENRKMRLKLAHTTFAKHINEGGFSYFSV